MRRSCASQRHYGRDLDASFRRRRIDDALPFFLRMCLGMFSVRKFVISLIGSSENHTWKVHECTSKGLHKKLFLPNQDEAAQFIFGTCSIFLNEYFDHRVAC